MTTILRTVIAALAGTAVLVILALAAEHANAVEPDRGAWFKSLTIPGTNNASCCDAADCHKTIAEWRKDAWWAVVEGKWRYVPSEKVLKKPPSIDGEAYVCSLSMKGLPNGSEALLLCFVTPTRATSEHVPSPRLPA